MPILNPTPGEVYDRLSILKLKISHSPLNKDNPFETEYQDLLDYLHNKCWSATVELPRDLVEINTVLWILEDTVRGYADTAEIIPLDPLVVHQRYLVYRMITFNNNERARIIKSINRSFGIYTEEKLYEKTE